MLTKEEYLEALYTLNNAINEHHSKLDEQENNKAFDKLNHLINEHFELQLTANECDLIILGLMKLENELGWDVTLLIKKVLKKKYISPTAKGVVDCVEID